MVVSEGKDKQDTLAIKEDALLLKEDILNFKVDMERGFRNNLKWTVGIIIACTGILLAVIKFMH